MASNLTLHILIKSGHYPIQPHLASRPPPAPPHPTTPSSLELADMTPSVYQIMSQGASESAGNWPIRMCTCWDRSPGPCCHLSLPSHKALAVDCAEVRVLRGWRVEWQQQCSRESPLLPCIQPVSPERCGAGGPAPPPVGLGGSEAAVSSAQESGPRCGAGSRVP